MVDIDERVVQMKFDATDFDQNTKKTMSTLDKLREKLSFKDVVDNNAMNSIADNVQKVADKAYTIVDRTIDKIKDNIANKLVSYIQDNTVGQLKAGWSKYADMTTSVATLKAQGYAMEDINEQLERLMYFTDETSYKFTDMVSEVGKFTASGQKLDDSIKAMMGIADWAALSGKNANEASRAMYQLSQALGAGYIRLQDWKSIQTLNMDTKEFREKALEAAEAVGTIKKNVDGTYKSLVGDKKTFNIQQFSETLSKGQWFTTDVMMKVFGEYADAVDEIRAMYLENDEEIPTAQIINDVKESNEELIEKFNQVNFQGTRKDITDIISRWKKVEKVTAETAEEYAAINDLTVEQAKLQMAEKQNGYAEYLKEYGQIFSGTVEDAEAALDDWHNYISEFGIKAFQSGQEAKTFLEAIESAKDAASTVWTNIYTTIFGDYNEAKEIWTHLANNLYDIFVGRLWSVADIFDYWKNGEKEALTGPLEEYEKELAILKRKEGFNIISDEEKDRIIELQGYIDELNYQLENKLYRNGRRMFMQGAEAIGAALKFNITQVREAWDNLFEENESAKKLLDWTERFRISAFKFATMIMDPEKGLASTDFYKNIAQGIMNLTAPIRALRTIIKSVISEFVPAGTTFIDILVKISESFKNITSKIVPSQQTILNLARILRGVIAVIKLIGKAVLGVYITVIRPIVSAIWDLVSKIVGGLLESFAEVADSIFELEEGLDIMDSMAYVGGIVKDVFSKILGVVGDLVGFLLRGLAPIINFIISLVYELAQKIKGLVSGSNTKGIKGIGDSLGNMAKRAKEAWKSTYSLSDVWNHYKGGSGLSNFIMMLGDMFDVLVTKIGVTIAAIFGFEKETAEGGMVTALDKVRAVAQKTFEIISWLYTNVLRPVLGTFLQGIGAMIKNLGQSFREGDIKGVLSTIREIISTFTSLQLFKMLQVITKVFGSGGLLRLMRNGAKALKGLYKLWGSEAINNISSALFKLGLTIVMVAAALAALTFLPAENLGRLNEMLISFTVVFAIVLGLVVALTAIADKATYGLLTMGFAFSAITAMVVVFIIAAKKLHDYLENLFKNENGGIFGGLVSILAPFLSVVTVIMLVITAIKKLGGGGTNGITFALGFVGIFIAVNNIVNSIVNLIELFRNYSIEEVIDASKMLMAMFALLALCTKLMGNITLTGEKAGLKSGTAAGIAMAIAVAAMALIIRMVLIPTLDSLLDNMGRWPDYIAALIIIAGAMVAIAGSIRLMNTTISGGFLHGIGQMASTLATILLLSVFVNIIKEDIVPLLMSFANVDVDLGMIAGIFSVGAFVIMAAVAIRIVLEGITRALLALASINWKPIMTLVLTIGLIILSIMALNAILEKNDLDIEAETVFIILGVIVGILVVLGTFATIMSKVFKGSATGNSMTSLSKMLKQFALMLGVIILGIVAVLSVIGILYKDNNGTAILDIGVFLGGLSLAVAGIFLSFAAMVSSIMKSVGKGAVSAGRMSAIEGILKQIKNILIVIVASIAAILLESKLFNDPLDMVWPLLIFMGGVIGIILSISFGFDKLLDNLSWIGEQITPERIKAITNMLKVIMYGVIGIMITIAAATGIMTLLAGDNLNSIWVPALTLVGSVVVVLFGVLSILGHFIKETTSKGITSDKLNQISKILIIVTVLTSVLSIVMGSILGALSNTTGENNIANAVALILGVVGVFGTLIVILSVASKAAPEINSGATLIATGIAKIAGALLLLGLAVDVLKSAFGLGKTIIEKIVDGVEEEADINSPSKEFAKDGKYIDQGLALGIKKNTYLAKNAAVGLATATNTAFQKELKIASPSKVFYENGKFVIRGFINGANSEYQKNKDIGAAIGEGFAENAAAGISDEFEKLWTESGMLQDMKDALSEAGTDIGSDMGKSLFDAFLGEEADDTEVKKQLTAQEQQYISGLRNEKNAIDAEIERLYKEGPPVYDYRNTTSYDIEQYNDTIASLKKQSAKLDEQINKAVANGGGTTKTRTGGIFGGLSDVFDGLGEEFGNVMSSSMLGKLGDWFKEGGEGFNEITAMFDTALGDAGGSAGDKFTSRIFSTLGLDSTGKDTNGTFWNLGKNIADGISDGLGANLLIGLESILLKNPMVKGVAIVAHMAGLIDDETYRYIMGATPPSIEEGIRNSSATNLNSDERVKQAEEELAELRRNPPVSAEEAKYKAQRIQQLTDYIEKSKNQSTTLFIQTDSGKKEHFYEYVPGYDKDPSVGDLFTKYISKKFNVNKLTGDSALGQIFESDEFKKSSSQAWFFGQMQRILTEDKSLYEIMDDTLILSQKGTDIINTLWKTLNNDSVKERNKINGTAGYADVLATMDLYIKNYDLWYATGGNDANGYINGFTETFGNNMPIFGKLFNSLNQAVKDNQQQKSPSKLYYGIGENDVLGFVDGFEETFPQVIKSVEKDYDLLNNTSITSLNAMVNAVENVDDITPTVTPIFDGGQLQNGVDTINSALDSVQPRVDSAIGSFGIESTDYTNNLNSLGNRIESTNALVNTLIGMLEAGAGVNINVTAEPDPTNIYNLVVDTNRTEFKRTGRNNLAY